MDPLDFLVRHAPFDALSARGRARIADALEITWARTGDTILQSGGSNAYLYTIRKGHVRLDLDGQRVAELGTGEIFGLTVLAEDEESPRLDVTAVRDCLLYRWPRETVRGLCDTEPGFAGFFLDRLADRLQRLARSQALPLTSDLGRRVDELVRRSPITLTLEPQHETASRVTVGDAARRMAEARVSSVLLVEDDRERPVGIVTDRDLRDRVLAQDLGPDVPARQVMSTPVEWIDAATPGSEALLHLLRQGRRHLVLEDEGRLAGVVSQSDLLRGHLQSPAALLETIHAAAHADDLVDYAERVARSVETLHQSGVTATDIGRLVAALNDALSARLLDLAETELTAELGPPPCDYAWIVFGSEGRREQSFLTDQDNALIYGECPSAEDSDDARAWFENLARRVVDSLSKVGFPECEGGFMATHWCLPLGEWERRFADWIDEPDPENLMRVLNFFDWRRVAGRLELDALESIVARARDSRVFIAQLARASMRKRPPLGLLHRIVRDGGGVDLKSGALMPIAGLARLFAIEAGTREGSTLQRLRLASRAGTLSPNGAEILAEAFRFTFGLRLKAQLDDREAGRPINHRVAPDDLSASERRHLREAFLAIDRMQKATESRLGTDHLG